MVVERAVAAVPEANVLPGPSRRITVEPIKVPAPAPLPRREPPEVAPEPQRRPDRDPVPAR
jgi:hypothetical protein